MSAPRARTLLRWVGLNPETPARLRQAIDAAREAQSQWVVLRDGSKSEAQRAREQRGERLRAYLLSAAAGVCARTASRSEP